MAQVTISPEAIEELRERVAREKFAEGVMILGPIGSGGRMSDDAEEARHLEIAYGPAPRWVIHILQSKELERLSANAYFRTMDIEGLRVVVAGAKSNVSLRVDLIGGSIRVSEQ
jgi:hypothetical protein